MGSQERSRQSIWSSRTFPVATLLPWVPLVPRLLLVSGNIHNPEESVSSLAWIALDAKETQENGVYYEGRKEIKSSTISYEETNQDEL